MAENTKKPSFLQGTALLAAAAVIVKVIGAIYSIPLKAIIGDKGFGYYSTAYEIYNVLLTISLTGLPVAMSRMISEASALGHNNQVRRIYKTTRTIFLGIGIVGSLLMILLSKFLAGNLMHQPDAWTAIACLGPSALFICIMSTCRGFFQGQGNMLPTSVSQVLEAIVKLLFGLGLAFFLLKTTSDVSLAAAGAILGVTLSCLVSVFYLTARFRKSYNQLEPTQEAVTSFRSTAKRLLVIAVPITIGSAGLSILNALEIGVYMDRLLALGYTQNQADTMKGIYNFTQKIFNLPVSLVSPVTISLLPAITAHITLKNHRGARATAESATRVLGLVCMPCTIGLMVLAGPVVALLGGYSGENLALATKLMTVLGASIIFNALVFLTNAIMQAHGHVSLPVVNTFIGGILKLGAVFMLTGNEHIHILGTPIGSLLCCITICILNIITMGRCIPQCPSIFKNLGRSFLASLIMGAAVFGCRYALEHLLHITGNLLLCAVPLLVGVAVYFFAAIGLKAITREDCMLLPKGAKIAKLLHL